MPSNLHHRPFTRLLLLILGILFLLAIIGSYGFYAIQRDLLANSGESLALAATDIADKIDRWILERVEDIDFMAQTLDLETQDPDAMAKILRHFKITHPAFRSFSIVASPGKLHSSTLESQINEQWQTLQGLTAIQKGQTYSIEVAPHLDKTHKGISLIFTRALKSHSGSTQRSLVAELPLAHLDHIFAQTHQAIQQVRHTKSPIEWQLLTKEGQIILDSILHEEGRVSLTQLDVPSANLVTSGKSGFIEEIHKRRGVPVITGYAQTQTTQDFPNPHWGILLRINQSDVLPAIHGKIFQLGMGISVVLLPLLAIIFWTARRAESEHQQLMAAETKYRKIFENAPEGIFQSTPSGNFISANPAMANILGYDSPQALLHSMSDFIQQLFVTPSQSQGHLQQLETQGSIDNLEFEFLRQDGTTRWASGNIRAVKEANGQLQYIEGTIVDITERKEAIHRLSQLQAQLLAEQEQHTKQVEAELNKAKAALITQAKLATLGQLSGSIAHELRNPLGAMRNATYLLKRRLTNSDDKTKQFLDMLEEEIQNSDLIIQGLLEVARGKEPIKQTLSLQSLLDKVLQDKPFPDTVTFHIELGTEPFTIWVDPQQFKQVLHNIFHNASQAMERQGHIWVRTQHCADMAEIEISDTGPGISEENRDQLFEPLFTTKAKGTGLGLTLCREIIEGHGGTIVSMNKPKGGASFIIRVPKYRPATAITPSDKLHHSNVECTPFSVENKK